MDYGMGNLRSVYNALYHIGFDPQIVDQPEALREYSHAIVPGVGAFDQAMTNLEERGLADAIRDHAATGKPLLGICLGMQLFAERGHEFRTAAGFGFIPGEVVHLPVRADAPIPHVGWNAMHLERDHPVTADLKQDVDFYFVHSYTFQTDPAYVIGTTEYGGPFTSAVGRDNIVAFQFHPEKSQAAGLLLLEAFGRWDGNC